MAALVAVALWLAAAAAMVAVVEAGGDHDFSLCCADVFGPCRQACENFSLVHYAAHPDALRGAGQLADIKRLCPHSQDTFWTCMTGSLEAVARGRQWSGRHCCSLGILARCRHACATSASADEVAQTCRHSDEPSLFGCLERQLEADECCGRARTAECMNQCQAVFALRGELDAGQRERLTEVCARNGSANVSSVLGCVNGVVDMAPGESFKEYAGCCDKSPARTCQRTCRAALSQQNTTQQVIDALETGGCGPPLPHDPLWQCFLSTGQQTTGRNAGRGPASPGNTATDVDRSLINQIGMDAAKQHCCHKAATSKCRRLCVQTFTNDWTRTRQRFETECSGPAAALAEAPLRQCLEDVEEPCELGCDGLQYCRNFNHRSTELFRSCNADADRAARADYDAWLADGFVNLTVLNIPIKNLSTCVPDAWQAIVCTLQVRPCAPLGHTTRICRADCLDVLSRCLDVSRSLPAGQSAETICRQISPLREHEPCISLEEFRQPAKAMSTDLDAVRFPCTPNPCQPGEVCQIIPQTGKRRCVAACRLGETSAFRVPVGRYVRVPVVGAAPRQPGCHKVCQCALGARIEQCQPLPCVAYEACMMAGRRIEHAATVAVECNVCSCYAGEITCTKRQCRLPGGGQPAAAAAATAAEATGDDGESPVEVADFTSLPCNCPVHYVPVCGRNGQTYPSMCVAKCAGMAELDMEFGACELVEPCARVVCPGSGICVPMRQVCLSVMQRPCVQYICVNESADLSPAPVVCPTPPTASIAAESLLSSTVCGINGVTYRSDCEALADYSWPDYDGPCREFGRLNEAIDSGSRRSCSPAIHCAAPELCPGGYIVPPGACCPICSGAIRLVVSRKQIDRALYALPGRHQHLVTLQGILAGLQALVRTAGCRVSGYLSVEMDLFVTVQNWRRQEAGTEAVAVSSSQLTACEREAEKLATLIAEQSAQIVSDVALSALVGARLVDGGRTLNSGGPSSTKLGVWRVQGLFLVLLLWWKLSNCS